MTPPLRAVVSPKRMGAEEFRRLGYLQEVNRCFLHPLGLALEVVIEAGQPERFGDVWDYRDDPEGIVYFAAMIDHHKAARIEEERAEKALSRQRELGFTVQPPGISGAFEARAMRHAAYARMILVAIAAVILVAIFVLVTVGVIG